ncbi:MAG TPA: DUF4097 family beta strand repeat-containing protein [Pyrinomonadaceae bacterium]|nr:DUF4097 family beta strand repeat-containing protein [Pyrinomonadaceae bacterium]
MLFAFALAFAPHTLAQKPRPERFVEPPRVAAQEGVPPERRASADPRAVVTVCLESGDIVVRGWDRPEVRARLAEEGGLRLLTPNVTPAPRVEVLVTANRQIEPTPGSCGSNERLEVTVPRGATVEVQSRSGQVEVADVAEVRVRALSGDVDVRRVSQSVEVNCLSGDVSVEDSSGPVRVTTTSGDVEARNVRSLSGADYFEAKSASGDLTLEGVSHRQVRGNVVSGSVLYTGALARGGSYTFSTISGEVTMELPPDSSFSLHAKVVASGDIDTDFPVKMGTGIPNGSVPAPPAGPGMPVPAPAPAPVIVVVPEPGKPGKAVKIHREPTQAHLDGTVGTGDAVVNLSSFSGSLHLRKR